MLCRCARLATASWRGAAVGSTSRPSLALLVAGAPSNGAEAQRTTGGADFGVDAPALQRQPRAGLSTAAAAPKLVYAAPREEGRDVVRTPPMEEEDTGPAVREMRAQLRPSNEHGSRGARKLRKEGKIPGVVYSNNDSSAKGSRGETFLVKVDKIVLDREIRRLKASFDNTVYDLVIEGARPSELDDEEVGFNLLGEGGAEGGGGEGEGGGASPSTGEDATATAAAAAAGGDQPERRELVLANETRLHPVFRTVLSVNWMRYKAGRKYPIPVKFINDDLNDNFKKGAYIRRMKSHQHIILPEDPEKVPKWLYLDLETVRSGSKLRVSDILLPEGILLFRGYDPAIWNEVVCTIKGRKLFGGDSADREDEDE